MIKINLRKETILISFITGCLLFSFLSCTKFLQVQPRDYMFEEETFSTVKGVESALNGIYQSLSDPVLYGNMLTMNATENMAQYYYSIGQLVTENNVNRYDDSAYKALFSKVFEKAYRSILEVNNFCTQLENPSFNVLEPNVRNILLGEGYSIRAFLHFDQLRLFGPIYTATPDKETIPYVHKANAEIQPLLAASHIISEILNDLDSALILLEKDPVRSTGNNKIDKTTATQGIDYLSNRHRRMNYFAVATLKARVLLYAGKNAEAWEVVNSVILAQEAFFPWQTEQQMAIDPVLSDESFFGIENKNLYDNYRQLFSPMLADNKIYTPKPPRLGGIYNPSSNDLRLKYWFKVGHEGDKAYKVFIKYNDASIADNSLKYYQPLIRKSELYLIAAETAPALQQGYFYLNSLRVSRGLIPLNYESSSTRTELLTAIRDEYQREFIGEGQTFFMFKRFNLANIPAVSGIGTVSMNEKKYVVPLPDDEKYYR